MATLEIAMAILENAMAILDEDFAPAVAILLEEAFILCLIILVI